MKISIKKSILVFLAVASLLVASIYQNFVKKQDTLSMLQQGNVAVVDFESLQGDYPSYLLLDAGGNSLGYGVVATASGYGGKLMALSIIDLAGTIQNVVLLDNSETLLYLNKVHQSGYLSDFIGMDVESDYTDLDMVTGATITSQAVLNSVRKGAVQIGNDQLGKSIQYQQQVSISWVEGLAAGLMVLAVIGSIRTLRKLRPWLLVGSVLVIGFILNSPLSSINLLDLFSGNFPIFVERSFWYVFVLGILLGTLLLGRNFYCSWLCPFGAVQEGLYKSMNLVKFSPSSKVKSFFRKLRWPVLWLAALLAILFNNHSMIAYEPFYVFFDSHGAVAQWMILLVVLFMSMLQLRFWCNGFCPTGLVLDEVAKVSRKVKKIDFNNLSSIPIGGKVKLVREVQMDTSWLAGLTNQDRIYAIASGAVILFIFISLIENIPLI